MCFHDSLNIPPLQPGQSYHDGRGSGVALDACIGSSSVPVATVGYEDEVAAVVGGVRLTVAISLQIPSAIARANCHGQICASTVLFLLQSDHACDYRHIGISAGSEVRWDDWPQNQLVSSQSLLFGSSSQPCSGPQPMYRFLDVP